MTEVSIDELKQARYMSLTSPPASPEAKSLVDSIIDIILSAEQRKRSRQPSAALAFKSAVGVPWRLAQVARPESAGYGALGNVLIELGLFWGILVVIF